MRPASYIALCLALGCGPALADEVAAVKVEGVKNPEMKNYRSVVKGLDAFDEHHAMAPAAELHFRMRPRKGSQVTIEGTTLRIIGDGEPVALPVAPDGLFTVPRLQEAYDSDALMLTNRKERAIQSLPDIRTPGLPDNVRRLGDLRLECKVMVAIAKDEIGFFATAMVNSLLLTRDWCAHKEMEMPFRASGTLTAARLRHGEREEALKIEANDFKPRLGDKSWPDDALIELTYAPQ
jgi:hypothetical protein